MTTGEISELAVGVIITRCVLSIDHVCISVSIPTAPLSAFCSGVPVLRLVALCLSVFSLSSPRYSPTWLRQPASVQWSLISRLGLGCRQKQHRIDSVLSTLIRRHVVLTYSTTSSVSRDHLVTSSPFVTDRYLRGDASRQHQCSAPHQVHPPTWASTDDPRLNQPLLWGLPNSDFCLTPSLLPHLLAGLLL